VTTSGKAAEVKAVSSDGWQSIKNSWPDAKGRGFALELGNRQTETTEQRARAREIDSSRDQLKRRSLTRNLLSLAERTGTVRFGVSSDRSTSSGHLNPVKKEPYTDPYVRFCERAESRFRYPDSPYSICTALFFSACLKDLFAPVGA
jgi:hypothetical protein